MTSAADTPSGSSPSANTPSIREDVAEASIGDEVEFAIDTYDWNSTLDVIDHSDAIEWDVPFGTDWLMRTIYLEAARAQYVVEYSSVASPPRADCYRLEEDGSRGPKRGTVEQFSLVEDDPETESAGDGSDSDACDVELPDDVTPGDIEAAISEHKTQRGGGAPKADLGLVADELDLSPGRTRTLTMHLGHYETEIREVVRRAGGGR